MNEFKTVVEAFRSDLKKVSEVMIHNFKSVNERIDIVQEQIGLLHEGQTAIQAELRAGFKDSHNKFEQMEKRILKLEKKNA